MQRHAPIEFPKGDTFSISASLFAQDGVPLNLTGAVIEWALFDASHVVVQTLTTSDIDVGDDPTEGLIEIILSAELSSAIPAGNYIDQLRVTVGSVVTTMWEGAVRVVYSAFPPV